MSLTQYKKLRANRAPAYFIETVIRAVCKATGEDITKDFKLRKRELVLARQLAMTISTEVTKASLAKIGYECGRKDHSTVLHGKRTIYDLIETDRETRNLYYKCLNVLESTIDSMTSNELKVCKICGGIDIKQKAWLDPNTKQLLGFIFDSESFSIYCNICQLYVELTTKTEHKDENGIDPVAAIPNQLQEVN